MSERLRQREENGAQNRISSAGEYTNLATAYFVKASIQEYNICFYSRWSCFESKLSWAFFDPLRFDAQYFWQRNQQPRRFPHFLTFQTKLIFLLKVGNSLAICKGGIEEAFQSYEKLKIKGTKTSSPHKYTSL